MEHEPDAWRGRAASPSRLGFRTCLLLVATAVVALAAPAYASAERPNISRVIVSRDAAGLLTFRIDFASPVIIDPNDTVQVAIDADRDSGTGVDGLDYSIDLSGGFPDADPGESLALLTAREGKPVASHPPSLSFSRKVGEGTYGFGSSSMAFSIPASEIGDPRRFDFYVFARVEGELDEAPSHVLFSAGRLPWTYPKDREPEPGGAYLVETYVDGSDITLHERPGVIAVIAAGVLGIGAALAVAGWGVQRRFRRRKNSQAISNGNPT